MWSLIYNLSLSSPCGVQRCLCEAFMHNIYICKGPSFKLHVGKCIFFFMH